MILGQPFHLTGANCDTFFSEIRITEEKTFRGTIKYSIKIDNRSKNYNMAEIDNSSEIDSSSENDNSFKSDNWSETDDSPEPEKSSR